MILEKPKKINWKTIKTKKFNTDTHKLVAFVYININYLLDKGRKTSFTIATKI